MGSALVNAWRSGRRRRSIAVVCSLLTAILVSSNSGAADRLPAAAERAVTVMSRNVYHGVDAEITAVAGATGLLDLLQKVAAVYQGYHARNFPERAAAIADEVAQSQPMLIGLQEAVLVRTDTPADGPATPATTVDLDYVQILLDALESRGLSYEVVVELVGLDVELPSALGFDVRHTDREVILARSDLLSSELILTNPSSASFTVNCALPSATLGPITIRRGWVAVDAQVRGRQFRFVSTHLDGDCLPFTSAIQQAQAAQIVSGPAATDLPIVLVGDMNSTPNGAGAAYNVLAAAGFDDAWSDAGIGPGFTCCQDDDLLNSTSLLSSRIDYVLFRHAAFPHDSVAQMTAIDAAVVGDEVGDRTPSGLWPSDHAGVVATLRLGQP